MTQPKKVYWSDLSDKDVFTMAIRRQMQADHGGEPVDLAWLAFAYVKGSGQWTGKIRATSPRLGSKIYTFEGTCSRFHLQAVK